MGSSNINRIHPELFLKTALFLFFFSLSYILYAENKQQVFPLSWNKYEALDMLLLESGLTISSTLKPFSADEVEHYLKKIDPSRLSEAGRETYNKIKDELKPRPLYREGSSFAVDASLNINIESYRHTNNDVKWQYGYEKRLPMVEAPLDFWLFNDLYADVTLTMKEDHRLTDEVKDNYWNIISKENNFKELDVGIPCRAFLSIGNSNWRATYGRDRITMGNGTTGNMMLSDYSDFYDFLFVTTYWNYFKFSAGYIYLEPWLNPSEKALEPFPNRIKYYGERYKAFLFHRLEMRFWEKVNFSIAEGLVMGGMYPQIRDFNFLALFHSWYEYERSNGALEADLEITPYRWINIHGQFFLNEYQTKYEANTNSYPTALGYLGGVNGYYPVKTGYIKAGFEWAKTDPLLYNRYNPFLKFTTRRRIWSYYPPDGFEYIDKPLGYYLGPDSINYTINAGYTILDLFNIEFEYQNIEKGEMTINSPYLMSNDAKGLKTPSGIVETTNILHLHLDGTLLNSFKIGTDLYYLFIDNFNHIDGGKSQDWQWVVSLSYKLRT